MLLIIVRYRISTSLFHRNRHVYIQMIVKYTISSSNEFIVIEYTNKLTKVNYDYVYFKLSRYS